MSRTRARARAWPLCLSALSVALVTAPGMTWAPEAAYDHRLGAYVVYWASNLYGADDPGHTGTVNTRLMYARWRAGRRCRAPEPPAV